jgi:prepilin-type N-terminal cleavage/methylation domain-containing protein
VNRAPRRRSFTLVELLVVITIIGILATIALGVVGGLIGQARDTATKATISKIQALLNSRSQAFDRLLKRSGYLTGTQEYQWVLKNYPQITQQSTRNMLATKLLHAKFFPQYAKEMYDSKIYAKPAGAPSIYNADLSAEILYDFLTQSNALGDSPVAADTFSAAEVQDLDKDGLPEFVDSWGNPLRFYRWPTRLFRSQGQDPKTGFLNPITANDVSNAQLLFSTLPVFTGNLTNDLARDPLDPLQDCYNLFLNPANASQKPPPPGPFENYADASTGVVFHTPATYYVMVVVSAGPDGEFGMFSPDGQDQKDVTSITGQPAGMGRFGLVKPPAAWNDPGSNPLTDDIVSLSIRAGGK